MIPSKPPAPSQTLTPVTHSKLLLVEGDTPMHFLEKLLQDLGLSPQIEIRNFRGVKDFRKAVIDLAATDEFQKLWCATLRISPQPMQESPWRVLWRRLVWYPHANLQSSLRFTFCLTTQIRA